MAYTKGDWEFDKENIGCQEVSISANNSVVCNVIYQWRRGEQLANALLISAAPELLEALEACVKLFNEALPKFNWGASALDANAIALLNEVPIQVSIAIKKARGEV